MTSPPGDARTIKGVPVTIRRTGLVLAASGCLVGTTLTAATASASVAGGAVREGSGRVAAVPMTAGPGSAVPMTAGPGNAGPVRPRDAALGAAVRRAVAAAGFTDVVDFGTTEGRCPGNPSCPSTAPRASRVPSIDTAVIELDGAGRVTGAADVLLSRDYPQPVAVTVDGDLRAGQVHWYRWDAARARGVTAWDARRVEADDLVPPPGQVQQEFMSPYPASVFQLMVAAGTLHLVDRGLIRLDAPYHYLQAPGSTCLGSVFTDTRSTRALLDRMITKSDNESTCMLLKQLGDLGQLDGVNSWLAGLGLGTLQLNGIDRGSGGRWDPGRITMTALDTARLLLLVNGAPGVLWHVPAGGGSGAVPAGGARTPVTSDDAVSAESRALLRGLLAQQGFNEVLSTPNWCGRNHPVPGIPQRVPERWIDPATGTVTVDGIPYGQDVRACNATAQVTFAHKTGLTYNFGADAGIVDSLPGARERHYIIVVLSDLGYRYADLRYAASPALPCTVDACYPEAFARLGRAVDEALGAPAGTGTGTGALPRPRPEGRGSGGSPRPVPDAGGWARRPGPGAPAIPV